MKLLVCLREPVQRTFSQYLDGIKNGKLKHSFQDELVRNDSLIGHSRYGTNLSRYLAKFPREQIFIGSFDELVSDPNKWGVDALEIPGKLHRKVLPAGQPRVRGIASAAKKLVRLTDRLGLVGLRGKAKTSPMVRNLLYRQFTDKSRPKMPPEIEAHLHHLMADEVQRLDAVAGTDFCTLWNYPPADRHSLPTPAAQPMQAG